MNTFELLKMLCLKSNLLVQMKIFFGVPYKIRADELKFAIEISINQLLIELSINRLLIELSIIS